MKYDVKFTYKASAVRITLSQLVSWIAERAVPVAALIGAAVGVPGLLRVAMRLGERPDVAGSGRMTLLVGAPVRLLCPLQIALPGEAVAVFEGGLCVALPERRLP